LAVLALAAGLVYLDSFTYPGFVKARLGVTPLLVLIAFAAYNLVSRFVLGVFFRDVYYRTLALFIAPVVTSLAVLMPILNVFYHPNFSFALFHAQPKPFELVSLFFLVVGIINFDWSAIKKHWQWAVFVTPILLMGHLIMLQWNYPHLIFAKLKQEDGLFEYLTFAAYLVTSFFAVQTLRRVIRGFSAEWRRVILVAMFSLAAIGAFLIAGEEISWGQRLLGVETPPEIVEISSQEDLTFHNLKSVIGLVYFSYAGLGIYAAALGMVMLVVLQRLPSALRPWAQILIPKWYWSLFFVPMVVYVYLRETDGYVTFGHWEEVSEMVFSFGIAGFIWDSSHHIGEYFGVKLPAVRNIKAKRNHRSGRRQKKDR